MVPCKSTAEEVPFEWSHHRILSTDSKVRTTLHVSIIDSGRESVNISFKMLAGHGKHNLLYIQVAFHLTNLNPDSAIKNWIFHSI